MEQAMSKTSKQERARKYAEGAQECARIAMIHTDEANGKIAEIALKLEDVLSRMTLNEAHHKKVLGELDEIVKESGVIATELDTLRAGAAACGTVLDALKSRVEGAKGTLNETLGKVERLACMVGPDTDDTTDTAQAGQ
jgi:hypothetical protein